MKSNKKVKENTNTENGEHFSMKEHFDFVELHDLLLEVASHLLRPGGRLVYLFHTDDEKPAAENKFPEHPELTFLRSSRDVLTKHRARHLITMLKK
jgi:hypothetical protein